MFGHNNIQSKGEKRQILSPRDQHATSQNRAARITTSVNTLSCFQSPFRAGQFMKMAGSDVNHSHQSIPLNGATDLSAPLSGCVICCTSVPDEKRVSSLWSAMPHPFIHLCRGIRNAG